MPRTRAMKIYRFNYVVTTLYNRYNKNTTKKPKPKIEKQHESMSKWKITYSKYMQIVKVPCINVRMHVHVRVRLRWHVNCARSAGVHSGEARVGSSSAKMLTEHIMRFKRPVFAPRDKKRFFWNRNKA